MPNQRPDPTPNQRLSQKLNELLSEYGVDRAGVNAAIDLAAEYGETQYELGWKNAEEFRKTEEA